MKKVTTLAALIAAGLALSGAALLSGNTVSAAEAVENPKSQIASDTPADQQNRREEVMNQINHRQIQRKPLPHPEKATPPEQQIDPNAKIDTPEGKRPLKAWEQKYYEEHPDALKNDQDKGQPPEGKQRNKDDEYQNWHRL